MSQYSISETGRLISDDIEMADVRNTRSSLETMDIRKAFDLLNHEFLENFWKKFFSQKSYTFDENSA